LTGRNDEPTQPRIEMKFRYFYSKVQFLQEVLKQWQKHIKEDLTELDNIEQYLELIKSPDGFFKIQTKEQHQKFEKDIEEDYHEEL
jgi:hypothetical protein